MLLSTTSVRRIRFHVMLLLTSCQQICITYSIPRLPGYQPATSRVHYSTSCNTQSSAPEDGRDHRPKHVELIGIINKPLLLHLVGVYIIYVNDAGQTNIKFTFHFLSDLTVNIMVVVGTTWSAVGPVKNTATLNIQMFLTRTNNYRILLTISEVARELLTQKLGKVMLKKMQLGL